MKNIKNLKHSITIKGEKFYFDVVEDYDLDYYWVETFFYRETKLEKRKKYWLFGPIIEKEVPVYEFSVPFNILSESYTKETVRNMVELEYGQSKGLKNRKSELERGEII